MHTYFNSNFRRVWLRIFHEGIVSLIYTIFCICMYVWYMHVWICLCKHVGTRMCICVHMHVEDHGWCQIFLNYSLPDTLKHWTQNLPIFLTQLATSPWGYAVSTSWDHRQAATSGFYTGAGVGDPNLVLTLMYWALYLPSLPHSCVLIYLDMQVAHWPEYNCPLSGSGLLKAIIHKHIFVWAF